MIWVNKRVEIAKLKLQRRTYTVTSNNVGESVYGYRSVFNAPLVVVGKVEDKKIAKVKTLDRLLHITYLSTVRIQSTITDDG